MTGPSATSFRELENARRLAAARNDPAQQEFLLQLNELLKEDPLAVSQPAPPSMPTIFVTGLPRSGTTLLTQIIAAGLEVGFVDCIAARFWLAPVYGLRLSKQIARGERWLTFESDSGTPASPLEPHEFSYFWQYWMKTDRAHPETGAPIDGRRIDWDRFVLTLGAMQREVQRPMVFKALAALGHLPALAARVPQAIFVHVERDPRDVAASLLATRRRYYGDESQWWSLYPRAHRELLELSPVEQVAGQVAMLHAQFDEELRTVEDVPVIRVTYADVCAQPQRLIERIQQEARLAYDFEIRASGYHFPVFESRHPGDAARRPDVTRALRHFCIECSSSPAPVVHHTRVRVDEETIQNVAALMRRGELAVGEPVTRLERALSKLLNDRPVACVSSGMAALQMTLHLLGERRSIAMPSFVCEALAIAAEWVGDSVMLLESDLETMNLPAQTEAQDILIAVHQFGHPAPVDTMRAKIIIEDAAHAIGASLHNQRIGTLAEFAFTSFYATKLIPGGYGGAVIAADERFIEEIRDLRQYNHRARYRRRFQFPMSDLNATIALGHLHQLPRIIARRREIAACYDEAFARLPLPRQRVIEGATPTWCRYVVRVQDADAVCAACNARGVEIRRAMPRALHQQLVPNQGSFAVTDRLCAETVSLPIDPHLTDDERQRVIDAMCFACG